jgi:hypothetical protein
VPCNANVPATVAAEVLAVIRPAVKEAARQPQRDIEPFGR